MLLLQKVSQQVLNKSNPNKLAVSSTTETLLKNKIFVDVFLKEGFLIRVFQTKYISLEQLAQTLRFCGLFGEELLMAPFIECFKTTTLRTFY